MSYAINEGSTKFIAADVVGAAHNPSSGEQCNLTGLLSGALGSLALATETNPAFVSSALVAVPTSNFSRPADTTAYTSGDLVANSTTAGSVVPLSWAVARYATGSGQVRRARLKKTTNTTTAATFRLHLYATSPTCTNGDNGAWLTTQSGYLGSIDLDISGANGRVFSDPAAEVVGTPAVGTEVGFDVASGTTIYGLLEARGAYTPGSSETFTVELEVVQF